MTKREFIEKAVKAGYNRQGAEGIAIMYHTAGTPYSAIPLHDKDGKKIQ